MSELFEAAVVGRAAEVVAIAAAIAGTLGSGSPARAALVITTGELRGVRPAPSTVAARRLRERLRVRELDVRATGRIVWCALGDADQAANARRAAAVDAPAVLAICGPRESWAEPLLDDAAIVCVAGDLDDSLTALALAGLRARGLAAMALVAPDGAGAIRARIGLGAPSAWRSALPAAGEGWR